MDANELYNNGVNNLSSGLKKYVYDIVTIVIIMAIIAASLHVFGITDLRNSESLNSFLMDWLPYFAAATMLNANLYQKGVFIGKSVKSYIGAVTTYSKYVDKLTGHQLEMLHDFCDEYNVRVKQDIQREILKSEGICFEQFDADFERKNESYKALKTLSRKQLKRHYGKSVKKVVIKAKRVKIKGINVNMLLSSLDIKDSTNLGRNEHQLSKQASIKSTIKYLFSTALMSLIVINDLHTWGWANLVIVIFKVTFLLGKTLMSYFEGYRATTVDLVAHLARKTDMLKEFETWEINKTNRLIDKK